MAKATVTTASGAIITVEGTHDEVASVLAQFDGHERGVVRSTARLGAGRSAKAKPTPMGLLSQLIGAGFFSKPKELGAVKAALEEQGHFYPVTSLSPLMLRLVRKRELRRIKEKNRWLYVN